MSIGKLRQEYHRRLCREVIRHRPGKTGSILNFADVGNATSIETANRIVTAMGYDIGQNDLPGQKAGSLFESITCAFLQKAFVYLSHVRPGPWHYGLQKDIAQFVQYAHLAALENLIKNNPELEAALGGNYIVKPDIVVKRWPMSDQDLNQQGAELNEQTSIACHTPLRQRNYDFVRPLLHASISCKWTLRSDRAQNTRTEALNLIRHRKGALPHVAVVTAEPLPTRLATLALGTGDIDCTYHFALPELQAALRAQENSDQLDMLNGLVSGQRLRDISDLPFDLAI